MTSNSSTTSAVVWVAIDIAKLTHQVLLELPSGKRRRCAYRIPGWTLNASSRCCTR